jgi:hypothetical protein
LVGVAAVGLVEVGPAAVALGSVGSTLGGDAGPLAQADIATTASKLKSARDSD